MPVQGVCNDSVATIQAAMEEPVTMFPCILAGQAKTHMAQTYAVCTCLIVSACLFSPTHPQLRANTPVIASE